MDDLFKNDEFIQFILNNYLPGQDNDEKQDRVFSSIDNFNIAMDCFKLGAGVINRQ